jgi:hypothetical protein
VHRLDSAIDPRPSDLAVKLLDVDSSAGGLITAPFGTVHTMWMLHVEKIITVPCSPPNGEAALSAAYPRSVLWLKQ